MQLQGPAVSSTFSPKSRPFCKSECNAPETSRWLSEIRASQRSPRSDLVLSAPSHAVHRGSSLPPEATKSPGLRGWGDAMGTLPGRSGAPACTGDITRGAIVAARREAAEACWARLPRPSPPGGAASGTRSGHGPGTEGGPASESPVEKAGSPSSATHAP